MMAYAGWYVLVGAAYCGLFYAFVGRKRSNSRTDLWADFFGGITGEKSLWDKILSGLLAPCIAIALLVLAWPLVLWISVAELVKGDQGTLPSNTEKEFAILDEHLVSELPVGDIELLEDVDDPLGGAPHLPFGHLNFAWEAFKAGSGNGSFWKFSGKHVGEWDLEWLYEGYAVVKEDGSRPYFLTRQEYLGRAGGSGRK